MYEEDKPKLLKLSSFVVLDYIRSIVEILISKQCDQSISKHANSQDNLNSAVEYENMIQKLEEECRNHVGIEQQLKLSIDNMQEKLDESEINNEKLKTEVKDQTEECKCLNEKVVELSTKCEELQKMVENFNSSFMSITDQSYTRGSTSKHFRNITPFSKPKRSSSKKVKLIE